MRQVSFYFFRPLSLVQFYLTNCSSRRPLRFHETRVCWSERNGGRVPDERGRVSPVVDLIRAPNDLILLCAFLPPPPALLQSLVHLSSDLWRLKGGSPSLFPSILCSFLAFLLPLSFLSGPSARLISLLVLLLFPKPQKGRREEEGENKCPSFGPGGRSRRRTGENADQEKK